MKKYGKHTLIGWGWRILMWIALTPILLFLLFSILIYLPPVQRWAVDKASEYLSEEMDMEVSVESVSLKFPLDFSMGGMLAVQEGDTVLDAKELDLSVKMLPLFCGELEVDGMHLREAKVNTRNIVDAAQIIGHIGEFSMDSHSTDIVADSAVISTALLKNTDLTVLLADTVPEDTTVSEPSKWKVMMNDVRFEDVKLSLRLTPSVDSVYAGVHLASANMKGYLDLGKEFYYIDEFKAVRSAVSYDISKEKQIEGHLDPNHIFFTDMELDIQSLCYKGTGEMLMDIKQLAAKERGGLNITNTQGRVEMDSLSLTIPDLVMETADNTSVNIKYKMDLNAFDQDNPGEMSVNFDGQLGRMDIAHFMRMAGPGMTEMCGQFIKSFPAELVNVSMAAKGNMQKMDVSTLYASVPGHIVVDGDILLENLDSDMGMASHLNVRAEDIDFVKSFLSSDVASSFKIPHGMLLLADIGMRHNKVTADADLFVGQSKNTKPSLSISADINTLTEYYNATIDANSFNVNQFIALSDLLVITGVIEADGKGFDVFSPNATIKANTSLVNAKYGGIDLSNSLSDITLNGNRINVGLGCNNSTLNTEFLFDGVLKSNLIEGTLNIALPYADFKAMGLSDKELTVSTSGVMDFSYNLDKLFRVNSHFNSLDMYMSGNNIVTAGIDLKAEATADSTVAFVNTGDLYFDFETPNNMFKLMPKFEKVANVFTKQVEKRELDLNVLKQYFPDVHLVARMGSDNPISDILNYNGIHFKEFVANVDASPSLGVQGNGHMYLLRTDSMIIDSTLFTITQDSSFLRVNAGVACRDQVAFPGFRANVSGYLGASVADIHLMYLNKKNEKGIDLGLKAVGQDSCINIDLYPEHPIIGYRKFTINDDNYIKLRKNKPIVADVKLKSMSSNCSIDLLASESDEGCQLAHAVIQKLDLSELMKVLPGMPKMAGLLNADVKYIEQSASYWVGGTMLADNFRYDGTHVGNVGSNFVYSPNMENGHDIDALLQCDGTDIAKVTGTYTETSKGMLDADVAIMEIPMSIVSPFIPDQMVSLTGSIEGGINVKGPADALMFNGSLITKDVHVLSSAYSLDLTLANDTIPFEDSRVTFDGFRFYAADDNPLTLNGYMDFCDVDNMLLSLSLYGKDFHLIQAKRTPKKVVFGDVYADFFARVNGSSDNLTARGLVKVLKSTDVTYIMSETPLYQGDRLDDIVTFVDFNEPPQEDEEPKKVVGIDMNLVLAVEDGAQFNCEFSADKQSYINVQGGGSITMTQSPEGVANFVGRYTINEGEMKYTLPVIPLKTFTIAKGSYIEFTGAPDNPILNIAATERTKASVSQADGSSRSVAFEVGLKISNTMSNMGLEFTIEAPEDMAVQNELAACTVEEKNKLAVSMLATGMYLSSTNSSGFSASNALNNFLQNEINNITGKALSTMVDVNVGLEQTTRYDGTTRTDYSFRFSRRFFSDRLNVVIGGKVTADGNKTENESGAYIDDVSLEWRLDNGGTQHIRLFHEKDYSNLIEGEMDKNGAGIVLRKKIDNLSELIFWKRKNDEIKENRVKQ